LSGKGSAVAGVTSAEVSSEVSDCGKGSKVREKLRQHEAVEGSSGRGGVARNYSVVKRLRSLVLAKMPSLSRRQVTTNSKASNSVTSGPLRANLGLAITAEVAVAEGAVQEGGQRGSAGWRGSAGQRGAAAGYVARQGSRRRGTHQGRVQGRAATGAAAGQGRDRGRLQGRGRNGRAGPQQGAAAGPRLRWAEKAAPRLGRQQGSGRYRGRLQGRGRNRAAAGQRPRRAANRPRRAAKGAAMGGEQAATGGKGGAAMGGEQAASGSKGAAMGGRGGAATGGKGAATGQNRLGRAGLGRAGDCVARAGARRASGRAGKKNSSGGP
ncbi:unnamed protein product, partial [Closterium sp. NIES-53]